MKDNVQKQNDKVMERIKLRKMKSETYSPRKFDF